MRLISHISILASGLILAGSANARSMERVLGECAGQQPFPAYAACIKGTYAKHGNTKKDGSVLAFYAYLDEILENFERSQAKPEPMSEAKARADVYRAWQGTIEASNQKIEAQAASAAASSPVYKPEKTTICHQGIGGTVHCFEH